MKLDRRHFLQSAVLATAGASAARAEEPSMRRWTEQRWVLDNIIAANGLDWDQPRTGGLIAAMGPESQADIAGIRARVKKYADIAPAFEAVARRREAKAREAEAAKALVTARENYYMAAQHWGSAQWPIDENSAQNQLYNDKKRETFTAYLRHADRRIEPVWIPFRGKNLPAWFHLPPGYQGGRIPAVLAIPGMDSFKERTVALYGDRWLNRGVAVLAVEGPGQYECPLLGIYMSNDGWAEAARAFFDWMAARPEIDPEKIGITGVSFGSYCGTIVAGAEPRFRACALSGTHHEPGGFVHDEEASPTFKRRFMYMSGYTDEAKYDAFAKSLTLDAYAEKIRMPYLCLAGEFDELSPMRYTEELFARLKGPKRLVVYQDSRHSVGGVPSANLGPFPATLVADWMVSQFDGAEFASERWFVEATGRVVKTAL
ncbi:MAG TPA: prolyl oligopeptidase family serine peptidase [Xanthobacteraceae bacterium]